MPFPDRENGASMSTQKAIRSYEYKNDYFYIVIRQAPELGAQAYVYCCGIKISKFDPICWGKAGICSNPAFKGLQQLRADVSTFALKKGALPKNVEHIPCGPMTPRGDGWYRENILMIDNATPKNIQDILEFSALDLVKTVLAVCSPDAKVPAKCPTPQTMKKWLDSLGVKNYKEMAPAPIARPGDQK